MQGLCCCTWAFSSSRLQASSCSGFSCCREEALGHAGFSSCSSQAVKHTLKSMAFAHTLSCSLTCGILQDQVSSLLWQARFFTMNHQESPHFIFITPPLRAFHQKKKKISGHHSNDDSFLEVGIFQQEKHSVSISSSPRHILNPFDPESQQLKFYSPVGFQHLNVAFAN